VSSKLSRNGITSLKDEVSEDTVMKYVDILLTESASSEVKVVTITVPSENKYLFNDAVKSADYMASNDRVINE
jgi:hypothetical protein